MVEYFGIPQEPIVVDESNRPPPPYWPSSTDNVVLVVVENLVVKYADLPLVLHNVSFSLQAKERVGLLGCTGRISFGILPLPL